MDRRQFAWTLVGWGLAGAGVMQRSATAAPLFGPKVKWQDNLKTAFKLAQEHDKPMLIVFGAEWCTFCHKLERSTLTERAVAGLIEREFIAVHLDFDIDAKAAEILGVTQLPATVVLSPSADLLLQHTGFAKPPEYSRLLNMSLAKLAELKPIRAVSHQQDRAQ